MLQVLEGLLSFPVPSLNDPSPVSDKKGKQIDEEESKNQEETRANSFH